MATTRIPKPAASPTGEARLKELKAMLERDPFNVNLRLMLASAMDGAGKPAEAVKLLQETVEKARRNLGVTYCTLGSTLMKVGKPDDALHSFDLAIELDPSNAAFYLSNKAAAFNKIGLADRAKAIYQDLLARQDLAKQTRRIVVHSMKEIR
ncbi:MAG: tetratricopeptide repeat protein [Planctomycetes bacterium]|nr:tetratricopeptide repeat protein [Planctomycetota bacterium]